MEIELICIVEGQGDEISVPMLIRRVAFGIDSSMSVRCRTWRRPKGAIVKPQGLEKDINTSTRRYPSARGILVLLDADRDCPATLGPELLQRAKL